ncbi:uridine kinase [Nocardioides daedukensis]|uniref:Uridine kinase n=1 Tax=Nocardioides daedukensis TaxID=634462 RepID=A0A7Y9S294_9ACTN|nr:uridine kinase [Nocardioides daedukensis]NYG59162.1 uridine kinase [Nocardioides daedukensis]
MSSVVLAIADLLVEVGRPLLVGVDGPDGAGKSHFARALAHELAGRGRAVQDASVDDFHHPRAHRHALGRTPETVWTRSYDYRAICRELLDPWRRGSGTPYSPTWHDLDSDQPLTAAQTVPERGILVVDGVFLQRPELIDRWDLTVYLDVPPEVTVARMARRDGTPEDPAHPDQRRYLLAQEHYRTTCDPLGAADVVVDNADWQQPAIRPLPHGGAWRRQGDEIVRTVRLPADATDRAAAIDRLVD